jgi:hypothetical protein
LICFDENFLPWRLLLTRFGWVAPQFLHSMHTVLVLWAAPGTPAANVGRSHQPWAHGMEQPLQRVQPCFVGWKYVIWIVFIFNNLKTALFPTLIQLHRTDLHALMELPGKSHERVSSCGRTSVSSPICWCSKLDPFCGIFNSFLSLLRFGKSQS